MSLLGIQYFLEKNSQVSDKFLTNEDENGEEYVIYYLPW